MGAYARGVIERLRHGSSIGVVVSLAGESWFIPVGGLIRIHMWKWRYSVWVTSRGV